MKKKMNTPPGWLERQARKLIEEQGYFLLAYDVINSREYAEKYGYKSLREEIEKFNRKMNKMYKTHLIGKTMGKMPPDYKPRIIFGFTRIKGDAGVVFLKKMEMIRAIVGYAKESFPFKVRWITARDEWDKKLKIFV